MRGVTLWRDFPGKVSWGKLSASCPKRSRRRDDARDRPEQETAVAVELAPAAAIPRQDDARDRASSDWAIDRCPGDPLATEAHRRHGDLSEAIVALDRALSARCDDQSGRPAECPWPQLVGPGRG